MIRKVLISARITYFLPGYSCDILVGWLPLDIDFSRPNVSYRRTMDDDAC